ncbi:hypothetical protein C731_3929 [Mycolicibacterium hassiacum DSM 44199]|jgi:hypothetical protein|uniref:Uncharacterized protein n=1 Tax=Mycolicibacterium hassiacum (strain DSM 44199 / CIP 105218 / JCM 12690 / 3849) TaxID=1122247 RepID=K5BD84_MYCHD|nr:hypothetical protein [Mycolicibacterium hassiacum]EKF22057.1 hypothetical protein C731_3929 [Mycolicibacterium hassiacum DSM 44199]MBX5488670.1 hypothetical protein [Mycolicibacterium hassiacum]MDA4086951.1 hypothetical protein [Mycolicibacterium hassiacum DSM 44199]PZN20241.1 MAG: hypothetical protein DIU75_12880 [Mycolicibacterium hassiacum]VCT92083.1 hypothetical protein MHAS_03807 [Mycolicibacterium hassiacum DSM 44199]
MTTALTFLLLGSPLLIAGLFAWLSGRRRTAAWTLLPPNRYGSACGEDRDTPRVTHDLDAVRTRFERQPAWPCSGAVGERR